ncbi:MAG: magnesium chelatase, partial [Chloroflexi bacterium]|nr:magnesium chelatase [Chloroflexota bacterium]
MSAQYPFSAIVAQPDLQTALLVNAIEPRIGGVLIQGERGTAKSTAARGLAALLPPARTYAGSTFNCGPGDEAFEVCDASAELVDARPRFVELPIGTSEDRVTGTLDLERTLRSGELHFAPGLLAAAHRGVLYIDEVNLLPDHLVDLLLDVAASGVHHVEREGISVRHPSRFLLIGTMNPEEGELRPQFLDRFGLCVSVAAPVDAALRAEIVRRRVAFEHDPERFAERWAADDASLARRLVDAKERVGAVVVPEPMLELVTALCVEARADGLRPDITVYRTATTLAALDARNEVEADDVYRAALLALPHRRRRQAPQDGGDPPPLEELIDRRRRQAHDGSGSGVSPNGAPEPSASANGASEAPPRTAGTHASVRDGAETSGTPVPNRVALPAEVAPHLELALTGRPPRRPAAVTSRGRATDAAAHQRVVGDTAYGDGAHELATFASMLRAGRRVARAGARA